MTAPRDMESICVTLESLLRLAKGEVDEARKAFAEERRLLNGRIERQASWLSATPYSGKMMADAMGEELERYRAKLATSARAVLSLRKADDVAFRAAVTVLVTDILGAGCWDSSNNEKETMP